MATKLVINPIPVKKPRKPRATTIAKAQAGVVAKVMLKPPPKVPQNVRQAKAKLTVEFQAKAMRQKERDLANPKNAKKRRLKEDAKLAKAILLATPIEKEAYSDALGCEIVERVSNGEHLPDVLKSLDVTFHSFSNWTRNYKAFREMFHLAREAQAHAFVSQVVKIADEATGKGELAKIKIDTRKWLASKILAPIYGDRIVHSGDSENPIVAKLVSDSAELLSKLRIVK
jgi:hypothetical protein